MKLNLLIVDDHPMIRDTLVRCFRGKDRVVTALGDPILVESWLEENPCDGIIMDMRMPQMNGDVLLSKLRLKYPTEVLPIVMFSMDATPELKAWVLKLGANDMISKIDGPSAVLDALLAFVQKQ